MNVATQRQGDNLVLITDGRVDGTNASDFQDAMAAGNSICGLLPF